MSIPEDTRRLAAAGAPRTAGCIPPKPFVGPVSTSIARIGQSHGQESSGGPAGKMLRWQRMSSTVAMLAICCCVSSAAGLRQLRQVGIAVCSLSPAFRPALPLWAHKC